jgi:hypothetical protein
MTSFDGVLQGILTRYSNCSSNPNLSSHQLMIQSTQVLMNWPIQVYSLWSFLRWWIRTANVALLRRMFGQMLHGNRDKLCVIVISMQEQQQNWRNHKLTLLSKDALAHVKLSLLHSQNAVATVKLALLCFRLHQFSLLMPLFQTTSMKIWIIISVIFVYSFHIWMAE